MFILLIQDYCHLALLLFLTFASICILRNSFVLLSLNIFSTPLSLIFVYWELHLFNIQLRFLSSSCTNLQLLALLFCFNFPAFKLLIYNTTNITFLDYMYNILQINGIICIYFVEIRYY